MYGQFENIPKNIKTYIEKLYGISHTDWLKVCRIINESFEKKRRESEKGFVLSSEKDIVNPF